MTVLSVPSDLRTEELNNYYLPPKQYHWLAYLWVLQNKARISETSSPLKCQTFLPRQPQQDKPYTWTGGNAGARNLKKHQPWHKMCNIQAYKRTSRTLFIAFKV